MGRWILIGALLAILAAALFGAYEGWTAHNGDVDVPPWAYAMLGVGVFRDTDRVWPYGASLLQQSQGFRRRRLKVAVNRAASRTKVANAIAAIDVGRINLAWAFCLWTRSWTTANLDESFQANVCKVIDALPLELQQIATYSAGR